MKKFTQASFFIFSTGYSQNQPHLIDFLIYKMKKKLRKKKSLKKSAKLGFLVLLQTRVKFSQPKKEMQLKLNA